MSKTLPSYLVFCKSLVFDQLLKVKLNSQWSNYSSFCFFPSLNFKLKTFWWRPKTLNLKVMLNSCQARVQFRLGRICYSILETNNIIPVHKLTCQLPFLILSKRLCPKLYFVLYPLPVLFKHLEWTYWYQTDFNLGTANCWTY